MENSDRLVVVVFAKIPGLGIAKSRIGATEGTARANEIYRELIDETAKVLQPFSFYVAYAGAPSPGILRDLFPDARGFIGQRGATLGDRLRTVFATLFANGYKTVCAVGGDCPTLTRDLIQKALTVCSPQRPVVLGPAHDGGYYLVCIRQSALFVFDTDAWSTPTLCAKTLALCDNAGVSAILLEPLSDIDTIEDYRQWKNTPGC